MKVNGYSIQLAPVFGTPPERSRQQAAQPHVLDASTFFETCSGVRSVLAAKRNLLMRQGWRHTLVAPGVRGGPGLVDCGGLTLPLGGYRFAITRAAATRAMLRAEPDFIEAADPYALGWAARDAARRLKIPLVGFCHSDVSRGVMHYAGGERAWAGRVAARAARVMLRRLYGGFDAVFAPSRYIAARLRDDGIESPVLIQPLGVDCAVFNTVARDDSWRRRLLHRLELAPSTRLLIYTGHFTADKHLQLLADAAAKLGNSCALVAVGAGPHAPRGPNVRLLPLEPDRHQLARILASCDVFVHAGDQEAFGLSALEAMACGTPVVVNAAAGLGELARGVAQTVPTLELNDWADAISDTLLRPREQAALPAWHRAQAHDWTRVVEQLSVRYQRLINQGTTRRAHAPRSAAVRA